MSPVLERRRPPVAPDPAVDPEALIEEARRRARRRRAGYAGATFIAIGAGLGAFFGFDGGGTTNPRPSRPGESARGLPQAASIVGTVRMSPQGTALFTARGRSLFVLVVPQSGSQSITVERVDPTGIASRRVAFKLPGYLGDVSAGPEGVYAGTSVIKRFTTAPDELVRIDPK